MTISQMNFFQRMWYILCRYSGSLLNGAATTMAIAIICTLFGCVIGFAVGLVQTTEPKKGSGKLSRAILKVVKWILEAYVEIFRGTPMMLQAAFIYYGMAQLFNINLSMWSGGILSVDSGQTEGAKAIGMNHVQTMVRIILPQALRNIMPQIGNNLIINIKDTCVLSIIGTVELFFTFKSISGALYTYFEAATVTMIIYFILTFTCSRLLRWLEGKMDGPANFDLTTRDSLAFTSGLTKYNKETGGTY